MNTLAEFGTGQLLWSMMWFTLFFIWIWLLITCFVDVFRDDSLGGWGKAGWSLFIIVVPYLAVFIYLIARGAGMHARQAAAAMAKADPYHAHNQSLAATASGSTVTEEIARLAELRAGGAITDEEYQALKAKAMA